MSMPPFNGPLWPHIQRYFPQSEWGRAACIAWNECPWDRTDWPAGCQTANGVHSCGDSAEQNATSYGPFQLMDVCWNPAMNPGSPFTAAQWAQVMDPRVNTWMASVVWSASGWRAWTKCVDCPDTCAVVGGPIPYPRGPEDEPVLLPEPSGGLLEVAVSAIVLGGSYALLYRHRKR